MLKDFCNKDIIIKLRCAARIITSYLNNLSYHIRKSEICYWIRNRTAYSAADHLDVVVIAALHIDTLHLDIVDHCTVSHRDIVLCNDCRFKLWNLITAAEDSDLGRDDLRDTIRAYRTLDINLVANLHILDKSHRLIVNENKAGLVSHDKSTLIDAIYKGVSHCKLCANFFRHNLINRHLIAKFTVLRDHDFLSIGTCLDNEHKLTVPAIVLSRAYGNNLLVMRRLAICRRNHDSIQTCTFERLYSDCPVPGSCQSKCSTATIKRKSQRICTHFQRCCSEILLLTCCHTENRSHNSN